jgi:hypothetical protein
VLAAIVILAGRLVVSLGQLVRRIAAPVARRVTPSGRSLRVLSRHLGAGSAVAVSQWLVLFQVIAIVYVFWRYQDFIQAFTHPAAVSPELLAILSPTSLTPLTYRSFVTLVMVGTGAAWFALLASPDRRAVIHRTTVIAGGAAMVLLLLMLVVPYRLLHHNEMPRTTFEGARCYELGQREAQVLLYCPDAPPEQRVKVADRTMLSETGVTVLESIFSEAPPLR